MKRSNEEVEVQRLSAGYEGRDHLPGYCGLLSEWWGNYLSGILL